MEMDAVLEVKRVTIRQLIIRHADAGDVVFAVRPITTSHWCTPIQGFLYKGGGGSST